MATTERRSATTRFVVIGSTASASDDFLLDDLPGTSGRLDVLVRCLRAALLVSHGVRRDVVVYLVLGGGPRAPRALRIEGAAAKFVRPDERSLAVLVKKALATEDQASSDWTLLKRGVAVARGGLDAVLADLGTATLWLLDESGPDIRGVEDLGTRDDAIIVGDHRGLDDATRTRLDALGARPLGLGPTSVHSEDAITIVTNELDRRR